MFLKSQMFFFAFEWFFLSLNVLERNSECFIFCEMARKFQTFLYSPKWMVWNRITSVLHYQKMATQYRLSPRNGWLSIYPTKYVQRTYKEYHSVCPSSELGLPPTPHPQASVPPPPCFWGEGNTRWRERGWESPNSDEGHTLWYSLYVRTLWLGESSNVRIMGVKHFDN